MSEPRGPIPGWLLERYALGLLTEEEGQQLLGALRQEPGGEARLARLETQLREESQLVLSEYPAERTLDSIQRRYERSRRPSSTSVRYAWVLVASAAALFLFWWTPTQPQEVSLFSKERMSASIGARAAVELFEGAQIDGTLQPDQSAELMQRGGAVLYQVTKRGVPFVVRVPAAKTSVSVRGTTFEVRMLTPDVVRVAVTEGHVVVENELGRADVYSGGCVLSSAQQAPQKIACASESAAGASQSAPASKPAADIFELSDSLKEATDPITKKKSPKAASQGSVNK